MIVLRLETILVVIGLLVLTGCGLATPSVHKTEDYTPLFAAADACDLAKVRADLERNRTLLKVISWGNTTLLHEAVGHNCNELVVYLLDHGTDPNVRTSDGTTALHMAARRGNITIAALLLQHGAKVNAVDSRNATPLDAAKDWKRTEMVSFLEQHGAQ